MSAKTTPNAARKSTRPAAKAVSPSPTKSPATKAARKPPRPPVPEPVQAESQQSQLISLLRSPAGGTIDQLMQLTGWQPHSVRGVNSGTLRKRLKLNVTGEKSVYRLVEAQA
jgi:hypothetical protein